MKISFLENQPEQIVEKIKDQLAGRQLGKIVEFSLEGKDVKVIIQKFGKSYLEFTHHKTKEGMEWVLTNEKIALTHKAFKGEVIDKISKIIETIGGTVS